LPPIASITLPEQPIVTLIVAMRNEAANIEACLRSIIDQEYPQDRLEVLVFDGESSDQSWQLATRMIGSRSWIRLLRNPRRIQAAAWNLGIDAAHGDVIGIMSGHAVLGRAYVRSAVEVLRRTGADMVGGPVRAFGESRMAKAIALASSTPFGVGDAGFRYLDHEQDVDTVFMGVSLREIYAQFKFDEEMVRNQDDELSYRLLDAGARIVCSPSIESSYSSRATLRGLWVQYFDYGSWKVHGMQKHPAQVRLRHLIPAAFALSLIGSGLLSLIWRPAILFLASVLTAYSIATLTAVALAARGVSTGIIVRLPLVYATLHLSYGLGVLIGLARTRHWSRYSVGTLVTNIVRRAKG